MRQAQARLGLWTVGACFDERAAVQRRSQRQATRLPVAVEGQQHVLRYQQHFSPLSSMEAG